MDNETKNYIELTFYIDSKQNVVCEEKCSDWKTTRRHNWYALTVDMTRNNYNVSTTSLCGNGGYGTSSSTIRSANNACIVSAKKINKPSVQFTQKRKYTLTDGVKLNDNSSIVSITNRSVKVGDNVESDKFDYILGCLYWKFMNGERL